MGGYSSCKPLEYPPTGLANASSTMKEPYRNRLSIVLGELFHMEGAQEVASWISHEYPEYEARAKRWPERPIW